MFLFDHFELKIITVRYLIVTKKLFVIEIRMAAFRLLKSKLETILCKSICDAGESVLVEIRVVSPGD